MTTATVTDPVCGMEVDPASTPASMIYEGNTYYFCSQYCRQQFEEDPDRYASAASAEA